jgi:hypothetical protein
MENKVDLSPMEKRDLDFMERLGTRIKNPYLNLSAAELRDSALTYGIMCNQSEPGSVVFEKCNDVDVELGKPLIALRDQNVISTDELHGIDPLATPD